MPKLAANLSFLFTELPFLDRFEATRAEFVTWRASLPQQSGPLPVSDRLRDHLPQDRINLNVARRFARWRFCRVPRADEWRYAFTEGGTYDFPWSDTLRNSDTLANTGRLGLGRTTLVGSFASGSASPIGPFDLLGNVAEWTADGNLRGGGYDAPQLQLRCAGRFSPSVDHTPGPSYGFRCCADATPEPASERQEGEKK